MKNKYFRKMLEGALIAASLMATACGNVISLEQKSEEQTESEDKSNEEAFADEESEEKDSKDETNEEEKSEDEVSEAEKAEDGDSKESEDDAEKLYEEVLSGDRKILFSDGEEAAIKDFWEWETLRYIYADVDGDGEDELCLKDRAALYVLEASDGTVYTSFEGCTYDMPMDDGDLHGIYYYRPGGAPLNEIFKFAEFDEDGVYAKTTYASWYDANENGEMDENDWFFLDSKEEEEVDMDAWLEVGQQLMNMKDADVDWEEKEL